jgi:hypothetical protein
MAEVDEQSYRVVPLRPEHRPRARSFYDRISARIPPHTDIDDEPVTHFKLGCGRSCGGTCAATVFLTYEMKL